MLYEPRRRRKRSHPFRGWFFKVILTLLLICAIVTGVVLGALYLLPVSMFMLDPETDLAICSELPVTDMNILLLGVDSLNEGQQRSDSMIVLSIGSHGVSLTSLMRDMVVTIDGYGSQKLNAAYSHGGPELAMRTVNRSLGLNISRYVRVDYTGFIHLVDALGGIRVTITDQEKDKINALVEAASERLREKGYLISALNASGEGTLLDGVQALAYSRIRKLDSDYNRTGRQRQLIEAIWQRAKGRASLRLLPKIGELLRTDVETNLTWPEMISLGLKTIRAEKIQMHRLPADGYFEDDGSRLTFDAAANITLFRQWIYGTADFGR